MAGQSVKLNHFQTHNQQALKESWIKEVKTPEVARKLEKLVRQYVPYGTGSGGREKTGRRSHKDSNTKKIQILYFEKKWKQVDIAAFLDMERTSVTKIISRLRKKGVE